MRRSDREITDHAQIEAILMRATVCRLAMCDEGWPYVVPLNFGYQAKCLFFHTAVQGRKLDIIQRNDRVCFEVESDNKIIESFEACGWSMRYASVIGFGRAKLIDDPAQKRAALDIIMRHYSDRSYTYPDDVLAKTAIIRIDIESMTGKRKP
ncbi:MAG TPA: pyridoxamine 5'-phosphate oxidase family protein [Deltaproteobacteria bacterium]|nr:pyridoxamine 5'-phosphate oxidase family protein [Deltaproteobacteria bacterium]